MNLFFKSVLLLLLVSQAEARQLFIISYESKDEISASRIKEILKVQHHIPEQFISLKKSSQPCKPEETSLLHICINANSEYKIVYKNREVLQRTFAGMKK
jgi:hypothetical protein